MTQLTHQMDNLAAHIDQAVQWLNKADGLLITAGAGIGVDSGLPDFRGTQGFWQAYPALRTAQLGFQDIASPAAFIDSPRRAWGFYGHRLQLYRQTTPHPGFHILQKIGSRMRHGYFVFTSNVDGQFQKAGFDNQRIVECHGTIHYLQCLSPCTSAIWPANRQAMDIDADACMLRSDLPACPHCQRLARPNILMFNDTGWIADATDRQSRRLSQWLQQVRQPVVIELGAGTAIPSVRRLGESLRVPLVRINPAAPQVAAPQAVGIGVGALTALRLLDQRLNQQPS